MSSMFVFQVLPVLVGIEGICRYIIISMYCMYVLVLQICVAISLYAGIECMSRYLHVSAGKYGSVP